MPMIWRIPTVEVETGRGRSAIYEDVARGLMVKQVKLGARAVGFPADEVRAITAARIAGASDDDVRRLVAKLHERRKAAMPAAA